MFEKEAEDSFKCKKVLYKWETDKHSYIDGFKDGVEFGYNKANEWHYVKDGDLPEVDNKIVLRICSNGYIDGKRNRTLKLLTRKEFPLFHPIYAWREIVLPETPKEDKK